MSEPRRKRSKSNPSAKRQRRTYAARLPLPKDDIVPGRVRLWKHFKKNCTDNELDLVVQLLPAIRTKKYYEAVRKCLHKVRKNILENPIVMKNTQTVVKDQMAEEYVYAERFRQSLIFRIEHNIPMIQSSSAEPMFITKMTKHHLELTGGVKINNYRRAVNEANAFTRKTSAYFNIRIPLPGGIRHFVFVLRPEIAEAIFSTPLSSVCHSVVWQYLEGHHFP